MMRDAMVCLALWGAAGTALAQERPDQSEEGWRVTIGAGALYAPTYEGDDDYRLSLLPNVQVQYGERFSASVQDGVSYRWINTERWRAGPIGRVKFSRNEDGDQAFAISGEDTDDLQGLGDVDTSIELGGFIERDWGAFTTGLELRQAVSGHDGLVADLNARWTGRSSIGSFPLIWSLGPRARIVDDQYVSAYFGVDAAQSLSSGLPQYEAAGGLYSYGLGASLIAPLDRQNRWSAVLVAGYDRLTGDAADSPLVRERGSPNQASIGLFVARRL